MRACLVIAAVLLVLQLGGCAGSGGNSNDHSGINHGRNAPGGSCDTIEGGTRTASGILSTVNRAGSDIGNIVKRAGRGDWSGALNAVSGISDRVGSIGDSVWTCADVLGSQFSALIATDEQNEVVALQGRALSSARDGKQVTWVGEESGTQVQFTPTDTRQETRDMVVLRESDVEPPGDDLTIIGSSYTVSAEKGTMLRLGPTTSSKHVRLLRKGEVFMAAASVPGTNGGEFVLVSENSRWTGYVSRNAVKPSSAVVASATSSPKSEDASAEGVVAEHVNVRTTCRTLDAAAHAKDGSTASNQSRFCQAPDGAWVID